LAVNLIWKDDSTLGERLFAEIDNDIAEIARVTSLIDDFGQRHKVPDAIVFHLKLAFDELLTNIISYGFPDGGRHKITTVIWLEGNKLIAEIIDDGIAFDPLSRPVPDTGAAMEDRDIGGLGIHFIRTVMDAVEYRRSAEQNYLKMVKTMPAGPAK
jgi:serine/threonine-protein kinase RsbW